MAGGVYHQSPLDTYYARREVMDKLPLPWNVKRDMRGLLTRPTHPSSHAMGVFLKRRKNLAEQLAYEDRDVKKENVLFYKRWRFRMDDHTLFGAGNLTTLLERLYAGGVLNRFIATFILRVARGNVPSQLTKSETRVLYDFRDICSTYEVEGEVFESAIPTYEQLSARLQ